MQPLTWSLLVARGIFQPCALTLTHAKTWTRRGRTIIIAFYISCFSIPKILYIFSGLKKIGSPSVFNRNTRLKEKRGRSEEKEIKGWINSPIAARCSSSFRNICRRRKRAGRDRRETKSKGQVKEGQEKEIILCKPIILNILWTTLFSPVQLCCVVHPAYKTFWWQNWL